MICGILKKNNTSELIYKIEIKPQTGKKPMVTKVKVGREIN